MKATVYVETTIPSYLTAWPSRDLVRAAHQQITREWWSRRPWDAVLTDLELYSSCQRGAAFTDRSSVPGRRVRTTAHLHTGRIANGGREPSLKTMCCARCDRDVCRSRRA